MKLDDTVDAIIPNFVEKKKVVRPTDNMIVKCGGKKEEHNYIIVKDPSKNYHCNFSVGPRDYQLHIRNEKTDKMEEIFQIPVSVIIQLTEVFIQINPRFITKSSARKWNKYSVIEMNSKNIPPFRWTGNAYQILSSNTERDIISKKDVRKMKFNVGVVLSSNGESMGLLFPKKDMELLVFIKNDLFTKVINRAIGLETITHKLKDQMDAMD